MRAVDSRHAQKDMFTKRFRTIKPPQPTENQIQSALIERMKIMGRPDCTYFHVPNGGWRFKRSAGVLKSLGVTPGVCDLIFIWPQRNILFLELKRTDKDELTMEQAFFLDRMRICGFDAECAYGLDQAIAILESRGLLTRTLRRSS